MTRFTCNAIATAVTVCLCAPLLAATFTIGLCLRIQDWALDRKPQRRAKAPARSRANPEELPQAIEAIPGQHGASSAGERMASSGKDVADTADWGEGADDLAGAHALDVRYGDDWERELEDFEASGGYLGLGKDVAR